MIDESVAIAPISSVVPGDGDRARARRASPRSTSTSGDAARCFITLTQRLAPCERTCAVVLGEEGDRLVDGGRTRVLDLTQQHAADSVTPPRGDMSSSGTVRSVAAWRPSTPSSSGSGINTLAGAALLARDGWSVCVLERSDRLGGAIRTGADYTLPGFTHEVLSSWHPLFTGLGRLRGARRRARRAAGSSTSTPTSPPRPRSPTARRCSSRRRSRRTSPSSTASPPATARPGSGSSRSSWPTPTSASACSGPSSGRRPGSRSASGCSAASADAGLLDVRRARARRLPRLDDRDVPVASRRTACSRRGCSTPVSGPTSAVSGFMTQVIACALQLGGMPVPVGGGVRLVDALAGIVTRRGRRGADRRRRRADPRRRRQRDRRRASRTARRSARRARSSRASRRRSSTARLLGAGDVPDGRAPTRPALPLRPRGDADPPRAGRAAALEGPRRRAPRADGDRPRHAGARRRLAGGQRGGARPAAGRGDDRRAANRARSIRRARPTASRSSGSSSRSFPPGRSRATPPASSTSATATWTETLRGGVRRPDRRAARRVDREPRRRRRLKRVVALSRRTSRRSTAISSAATSTRGSLRARPEPPLAAARGGARAPDDRRGPVAHRREHASRPGARRRLGLPRREGADEAAARRGGSLQSFQDAREAVALARSRQSTRRSPRTSRRTPPPGSTRSGSGSSSCRTTTRRTCAAAPARPGVAICVPAVPSFLPLAIPGMEGPADAAGAHRGDLRVDPASRGVRARVRRSA